MKSDSRASVPKFNVGQVVAECYDFHDGKGEFVKSYFALSETLAQMYNRSNLQERRYHDYWVRELTARERGDGTPRTKGKRVRTVNPKETK